MSLFNFQIDRQLNACKYSMKR